MCVFHKSPRQRTDLFSMFSNLFRSLLVTSNKRQFYLKRKKAYSPIFRLFKVLIKISHLLAKSSLIKSLSEKVTRYDYESLWPCF